MRGAEPTVEGIELDLHELVLPVNLIAPEESLSLDEVPEEEQKSPYQVDTYCNSCRTGVRFCVFATTAAIRTLQQLLLEELSFLCISCSRNRCHHGRS
uniref:Protein E7 n=1 Tax=Human papillomavirus TaxID=10566 RepID=A0A385PHP7_9PAPI|nr:MAG: E7 protein [Human papillomavirus]